MTRSLARRLLAVALAVGTAVDLLFRGHAPGINVPLAFALLLVAGAILAGPSRIRGIDPLDAWLAPAALVLAAFVAIRADPALVLVDVAGAVILGGAALVSLGGRALLRSDASSIAAGAGEMVVATILGAAPALGAVRSVPGPRPRRTLPRWAGPLLRGGLFAAPLLVVFAALFAAADAVFATAAGQVLEIPFRLPLAELAERTATILVVAWAAAGALAVAAGVRVLHRPPPAPVPFSAPPEAQGTPVAGSPPGVGLRIGHDEGLVVLLAVDALFAAFVGLQVAYLFGGQDTLASTGLTHAEYARRGFFELLAAAALAAAVVATLDARVRRRSRAFVAAAVGLVGLTGVTLVSSFLRLRLYQDAYGWTELRFWVLLSIGWLAVALVALAALVALDRSRRLVHVLGVLGVAAVLVANLAGPQRFVAERNLERAVDPALVPADGRAGLDAAYLASLGDDAVPAMVAALPRLPDDDARAVRAHLETRRRALASDPAVAGWPAWNLSREQARAALDAPP